MKIIDKIFQISDLHSERDITSIDVPDSADVIVVAGDIVYPEIVFEHFNKFGKPIVAVLGNHDFWGRDVQDAVTTIKEIASQYPDCHVLDDEKLVIGDTRFVGSTFWTNYGHWHPRLVLECERWINDYIQIGAESWFLNPEHRHFAENKVEELLAKSAGMHPWVRETIQNSWTIDGISEKEQFHPIIALWLHEKSLKFIEKTLTAPFEGKTVIVTHHAPTLELVRDSELGRREIDLHAYNHLQVPNREAMDGHITAMRIGGYGNPYEQKFIKPGEGGRPGVRLQLFNQDAAHPLEGTGELTNFDVWLHGHNHKAVSYGFAGKRFSVNAQSNYHFSLIEDNKLVRHDDDAKNCDWYAKTIQNAVNSLNALIKKAQKWVPLDLASELEIQSDQVKRAVIRDLVKINSDVLQLMDALVIDVCRITGDSAYLLSRDIAANPMQKSIFFSELCLTGSLEFDDRWEKYLGKSNIIEFIEFLKECRQTIENLRQ
ncbi:metallophosphoesterase [uncultured Methylophaga sp.]|uniref:metallophosphoesterase family protein n=1 Tax=uncultured Methylophaga sp. TaxID=285271 RepID=UPI002634DB6E|nr:metallophosphoesterase [uncultured Methylophaga sp.]